MIYFLQHCWDINTSYFFFWGKSSQVLWAKQQTYVLSVVDVHWNPNNQGVEKTDNYSGQSGTWIQDLAAGWILNWWIQLVHGIIIYFLVLICKKNKSINHCWSLRALKECQIVKNIHLTDSLQDWEYGLHKVFSIWWWY